MPVYTYRERAREFLRDHWLNAILVSFVAGLFGATLISNTGSVNIDINQGDLDSIRQVLPPISATLFQSLLVSLFTAAIALGAINFIFGGVIQLGYCRYLLNLESGKKAGISDLFSQFNLFGKAFLMNLLRSIYVALWGMLFVIPGLVASYKYMMAPFILLENPGLTANEAITASKQKMYGRKFDLFVLDLSFIGWNLLAVLTLGILNLWIIPYHNAAIAAFYRQMVSETKPEGSWNDNAQNPMNDRVQQRSAEMDNCFTPFDHFHSGRRP